MMFTRKFVLIALLAVVLFGSFMGGGVELIKRCHRCKRADEISLRHRIKHRADLAGAVAAVNASLTPAKMTSVLKQAVASVLGSDSTSLQATSLDQKPRRGGHKGRTAMDTAGSFKLAG